VRFVTIKLSMNVHTQKGEATDGDAEHKGDATQNLKDNWQQNLEAGDSEENEEKGETTQKKNAQHELEGGDSEENKEVSQTVMLTGWLVGGGELVESLLSMTKVQAKNLQNYVNVATLDTALCEILANHRPPHYKCAKAKQSQAVPAKNKRKKKAKSSKENPRKKQKA
jgi:hypothetical protein